MDAGQGDGQQEAVGEVEGGEGVGSSCLAVLATLADECFDDDHRMIKV